MTADDQGRPAQMAHGSDAEAVLNAYADAASNRFVDAYLSHSQLWLDTSASVSHAWTVTTTTLHLPEVEAVGWAYTDVLGAYFPYAVITAWTNAFGPAAYLWVLAGYDLAEAVALRDTGTVITEDQLRVMVALAGVILPAGI
ncbi:MAG: hypothetical protein ACOH1Y_18350 [Propionicimonas sp.]